METMYILILLTGAVFLFFILFTGEMMRRRLREKEEDLLLLYDSVEKMMNEFQNLVRESHNEWERKRKGEPKGKREESINMSAMKRQKIEGLLAKGKTISEIARELKIGQGEVQLILGRGEKEV